MMEFANIFWCIFKPFWWLFPMVCCSEKHLHMASCGSVQKLGIHQGFIQRVGRPGIPPPPPEKIDGNIISIMNVDVHYRK